MLICSKTELVRSNMQYKHITTQLVPEWNALKQWAQNMSQLKILYAGEHFIG